MAPIIISELLEVSVKIVINENVICDMLCTPKNIEYLIRGWLFSEGFVYENNEIIDIYFDEKQLTVYVKTRGLNIKSTSSLSEYTVGALWNNAVIDTEYIDEDIENKVIFNIRKYGDHINEKKVKGLHAALLVYQDIIIFDEDISRHCAIDKVVGRGLVMGVEFTKCILVTTGRISSEFLWKAHSLNITLIASLKYPSETGYIVAQKMKINLASKICTKDMTLNVNCSEAIEKIFKM